MAHNDLLTKADLNNFKNSFLKWYIGLAGANAVSAACLIRLFG
jgi:hypothetical protein